MFSLLRVETWTLNAATVQIIQAFEICVYKRALKISWMDRVTITEVLSKIDKEIKFLDNKLRKLRELGHIVRGERYPIAFNNPGRNKKEV